jgi:hypothetical protein
VKKTNKEFEVSNERVTGRIYFPILTSHFYSLISFRKNAAYAKSGGNLIHLPCAGITLFRFYGYHLSLSCRRWQDQHPEESEKSLLKNRK